ncbi:MAG: tryptophan synthase subunit alpha [Ignavibacteriaceae bacterium]
MSFISDYIDRNNSKGEKILSVFLTSGFPDKNTFVKLASDVLNAGADMLEIGFPFSDPLADGPIIQASSQAALENNINLEKTFEYVKAIRKHIAEKPLILMGYANPVLNYGIDKFANDLRESGANGVIIPDVPIEEYDNFFGNSFNGIDVIMLITPTTSDERIKQIDQKSSGFIYCVSISGTTGNFNRKASDNLSFIKNTYSLVKKNKMLVGFGVSNAEDAKQYSQHCDGVIVGSAVIKSLMNKNGSYNNTLELVKQLKEPLKEF